jgi:hypothetical protein
MLSHDSWQGVGMEMWILCFIQMAINLIEESGAARCEVLLGVMGV